MQKKDEENSVGFFLQDKTTVLQEARVFNESPISPRKCRILLAKIVYLLYSGETFNRSEATSLFFGVTKLFQHKDSSLRQMVYLVIKELSNIADDVIMVTSSIMKDMQPNLEVIYRPNAIRALCRIVDGSMIQGVERFFKAAIVDKNPSISSAALVSTYHLFPVARDVIRRWSNETHEALQARGPSASMMSAPWGNNNPSSIPQHGGAHHVIQSTSYATQYHALGLLYLIRQNDRMAVAKLVQQHSGGKGSSIGLRNPYAICMLVRYAAKVMQEDPNLQRPMFELIESYLRHKSEMVNYEAARVICDIPNLSREDLAKPVAVLQSFLTSNRPATRFASIRTLSKLAHSHPSIVATCNMDIEQLINDDNRSVATYAIATLLKTGTEQSVDRLMKKITAFMSEISDDFKVIVVNAIRTLCLKFPAKQPIMLTFLSGILRDEGGYDFKRAVVEAIFDMIRFIKESKEAALAQLCEFIEDCEFTKLSVRILHLLGIEGPKAPQPSKYIRFIYNRVVLENAIVRAAAVSALAKFGVNVPDDNIKKSIKTLLLRSLDDVDDEVRDRAAMYLKVLDSQQLAETYVKDESTFSLSALENSLVTYLEDPEAPEKEFDVQSVPKISREQAFRERQQDKSAKESTSDSSNTPAAPTQEESLPDPGALDGSVAQALYAKQLAQVPEFTSFGQVLYSSPKPIDLTEKETEYVVTCVKHIFNEHIVFQFNVKNTLPDTILEQVSVVMEPSEETAVVEDFIIPIPKLSAQETSIAYASFTRYDDTTESGEKRPTLGSLSNTLKFVSKEVDPDTGEPEPEGYSDEYQIEDIELGAGDYIIPSYSNFNTDWDNLESAYGSTETFTLSALDSLKTACTSLVEILNMEPLGGSEEPTSAAVHTLTLSGLVIGGGKVLVRARMTFSSSTGVTMELAVRSDKEPVVELVMNAIA